MAGRTLGLECAQHFGHLDQGREGVEDWGLAWVNDAVLRTNRGVTVRLLSEQTKIKHLLVCPRNHLGMEDIFVKTLILILETEHRVVSQISFLKEASIDFIY